jgi:hypothetical protein
MSLSPLSILQEDELFGRSFCGFFGKLALVREKTVCPGH